MANERPLMNLPELMTRPMPILLACVMASCAPNSSNPVPRESKFIKSEGGGVVANNTKSKPFTYTYSFRIKPNAPRSTGVIVRFPSPDGITSVPPEDFKNLLDGISAQIESKPFAKIKNNATLTYYIVLYDMSDKRVVDTLEQDIRFSMSPSLIKAFGLEKNIQ
jgi:hypothetical protein